MLRTACTVNVKITFNEYKTISLSLARQICFSMKWRFTRRSIIQKQFIKSENIAGQCQDKFKSDPIQAWLDKCAFAPKQSSSRERLLHQERPKY